MNAARLTPFGLGESDEAEGGGHASHHVFLKHTATEDAEIAARAVVAACRLEGWQVPTQPKLLRTLFHDLLGKDYDFETLEPNDPPSVAATLRSPEERMEIVQLMCAIEILCEQPNTVMDQSVASWASALGVPERSLSFLRDLAQGEVRKSLEDFYRLNWIGDLSRRDSGFEARLLMGAEAYTTTLEPDEAIATRYARLSDCPPGSIGRHLSDFYDKRGFLLPGVAGAASEAVAHHDWIHLLADYGTTPLGEIEVLSFINGCTEAPGAFLGLVGALALFESGILGQGFVTSAYPHQGLSRERGAERMAHAIERGKQCNTDLLLDVEFFSMADEPLIELRERFGIHPRADWVQELDPWGALDVEPMDGP